LPTNLKVVQPFPNPFNNFVTIEFSLQRVCKLVVEIRDMKGKTVTVLDNGVKIPGNYSLCWQPEGVSPGVYFVVWQNSDETIIKRVVYN
jgi:hypothetical protein